MNGANRPGPRFGLLGILVGLIFIGIVAAIAYNVGLSAGLASTGGTAPVVYGPWLGFGGFHLFGFLFSILIFALLLGAIFRPRGWGHHGWRGGYGPGPWDYREDEMRDVPPPFEPMLEAWHRRVHGERPTKSEDRGSSDQASS